MDINLFNLRKMFQPDQMVGSQPIDTSGPMIQPMINQSPINDQMNQMYQPEHTATDQFNQLLSQYPTREKPSLMRKIGAALLNVGGQDGMAFLDQPNQQRIEDWKNRINPTLSAANLERQSNINERQLATSLLANQLATRKTDITESQGQQKIDLARQRADALTKAEEFKRNNPDWQIRQVEGKWTFFNPKDPNAKPINTGLGDLSETEQANLNQQNALERIAAQGQNQLASANARIENTGWQFANIPDPNDPTKVISAWVNPNLKQVEPIKVGGQTTTITKPGAVKPDITAQTRAMMEGAQMLLGLNTPHPHVNELRSQAADLDRRGLFGPIMSRVRNLAAKFGTTGSPEQVQKNLEDLANAITSDPLINQSNDFAVGQFVSNLGFMTSGMGRVHGGARGGGSIQMINYLKGLLGSESSLSMFNGRLQTLESYLKGYAAGPVSNKPDKLDSALDKIFGAK